MLTIGGLYQYLYSDIKKGEAASSAFKEFLSYLVLLSISFS
jgi:hypothetical protein